MEYNNIEKIKKVIKRIEDKSKLEKVILKTKSIDLKELLLPNIENQEIIYSLIALNQDNKIALKASEYLRDEKFSQKSLRTQTI